MINKISSEDVYTHEVDNHLKEHFGLDNLICKNLNTLANDAVEVTSSTGHFALKLCNPARIATEVQWEIDLTLHLIKTARQSPVPLQERMAVIYRLSSWMVKSV